MVDFGSKKDVEMDGGEEVYSRAVRAGRRTYFFDVKATRNGDYFLTITESRKKQDREGNFIFEKHKIYLYKEDFEKFEGGFLDAINYVKTQKPEFFAAQQAAKITGATGGMAASQSSIDEEFDKL